jgi:hypothetical protein
MSKACQYATNEVKVGANMKKVNLKDVQVVLQKIITWTKKFEKGKHEERRLVMKLICCTKNSRPL